MAYRTPDEVAARVRELREERGMSQRSLAGRVGLDPAAMSRVESNDRGLSTGDLVAIAQALEVEVDTILRSADMACALRASCPEEDVRSSLGFFRDVIADCFALEALTK